MPLDPQIFRDLDADRIREEPLPPLLDRLVYMGIRLAPSQQIYSVKFPEVIQASYERFARYLNYRPWNKALVRKRMARDRRVQQLESYLLLEQWLGAPPATIPVLSDRLDRMMEAAYELRLLDGIPLPEPQSRGRLRGRRSPLV